ncbi:glutathione S-transferase [Xylaria longipes]|nr:glutathione S-transferase [Xylaria longipes]
MAHAKPNCEVVTGDHTHDGWGILYIIKVDQASYINYIKPLILGRTPALSCDLRHDTKSEWYCHIHPERYIPALRNEVPEDGREFIVFESTVCFQYLAVRFDRDRYWADILEKRLAMPQQNYVALPDRPIIADLSYFPFAMPWMFNFLGSEIMLARLAVQRILERGSEYGHDS